MTIEATSATGDPAAVTFDVERAGGAVTIEDRYGRPVIATWRECLPPLGERGDFWTSDVVMNEVIYAPSHLTVHVEIMDPRPLKTAGSADRAPLSPGYLSTPARLRPNRLSNPRRPSRVIVTARLSR